MWPLALAYSALSGSPLSPGFGFYSGGEGERVSAGEMDGGMVSDRGVKKGKEREIV